MVTYADTSFLVSVYAKDDNTERARAYFASNPEPICLTSFSRSEAQHAIRLQAFQGRITNSEMTQSLLRFERDEAEDFYQLLPVASGDLFLKTSQLSNRHTFEFGIRYLDLLHIAAAQLSNAERFLTFDLQQAKLAKAVGLQVKP